MAWRKISFHFQPLRQWHFCKEDDPAKTQSEEPAAEQTGKQYQEPITWKGKKSSLIKNIVN